MFTRFFDFIFGIDRRERERVMTRRIRELEDELATLRQRASGRVAPVPYAEHDCQFPELHDGHAAENV